MRTLLGLVLLVGVATAWDAPTELQVLFGGKKGWGRLPEWRQKEILRPSRQFLALSEKLQREIRRRGLKAYLIRPAKRFRLPQPLGEEIARLPRKARPLATKLAVLRLRHMRFDRNLRMVPMAKRRDVFDRLFPEPFDRAAAAQARKELERHVSGAMVRQLIPLLKTKAEKLGRDLTRKEKADLVRARTAAEEDKIIAQLRKELRRLGRGDPERIQRALEQEAYPLLEKTKLMATPRQRELVRYALRPERCPLIGLDFMGRPPQDPEARRLWGRDFRVLARIELLAGDFPPEMVLHLAAAVSPADFIRATKALVRQR